MGAIAANAVDRQIENGRSQKGFRLQHLFAVFYISEQPHKRVLHQILGVFRAFTALTQHGVKLLEIAFKDHESTMARTLGLAQQALSVDNTLSTRLARSYP